MALLTTIIGEVFLEGNQETIRARYNGEGKYKGFTFKSDFPYEVWSASLAGLTYGPISKLDTSFYNSNYWYRVAKETPEELPDELKPPKYQVTEEDRVCPIQIVGDGNYDYFTIYNYSVVYSKNGSWVLAPVTTNKDATNELIGTLKTSTPDYKDVKRSGFVVFNKTINSGSGKEEYGIKFIVLYPVTIQADHKSVRLRVYTIENSLLTEKEETVGFNFPLEYATREPIKSEQAPDLIRWLNYALSDIVQDDVIVGESE